MGLPGGGEKGGLNGTHSLLRQGPDGMYVPTCHFAGVRQEKRLLARRKRTEGHRRENRKGGHWGEQKRSMYKIISK